MKISEKRKQTRRVEEHLLMVNSEKKMCEINFFFEKKNKNSFLQLSKIKTFLCFREKS